MSSIKSFLLIFIMLAVTKQAATQCPVLPQPLYASKQISTFQLSNQTAFVITDQRMKGAAYYLQQKLLEQFHIAVNIQSTAPHTAIRWVMAQGKDLKAEGYNINMSATEILVSANDEQGAFYAAVSLLQLISNGQQQNNNVSVPCWNITDAPLYVWRGLMLDESRHFFGKEKVKSILDWMVFYKLNRFHWHLTDEPSWRLEIKKYPMLALVGGIGSYTNPHVPAQYYTQQEVREIVAYAAERHITVIPEIDMPGHATAANRAYPEYSGGGNEKHPEFTFNPGKEETYQYLANILRETNTLFPSAMLHLGGDEVHYGNDKWAIDTHIKQLMQKNKLANIKEVEHYFMQRMADSVYALQAKLLAWDEMADLNLPKDKTIIFWWRQEKPEQLVTALSKGYQTVLCPRLPFYFDFVQDSTHTIGRKWNKQYNALQDVYDFKVQKLPGIAMMDHKQVIGLQANVWTETMPNKERLDYMLFPRIAALAETAWTTDSNKNFEVFTQKMKSHLVWYKKAGINYFDPEKKK